MPFSIFIVVGIEPRAYRIMLVIIRYIIEDFPKIFFKNDIFYQREVIF